MEGLRQPVHGNQENFTVDTVRLAKQKTIHTKEYNAAPPPQKKNQQNPKQLGLVAQV